MLVWMDAEKFLEKVSEREEVLERKPMFNRNINELKFGSKPRTHEQIELDMLIACEHIPVNQYFKITDIYTANGFNPDKFRTFLVNWCVGEKLELVTHRGKGCILVTRRIK